MGIQYRKRTKGKSGWFNFSYSDKRGLGMSTSVKVGGVTHNFGSKRASRTTVNLGNGLKYVSYGQSRSKPQRTNNTTDTVFGLVALMVILLAVITLLVLGGWMMKIFALGVFATFAYLIYKSR
jgi:hypothetical protein